MAGILTLRAMYSGTDCTMILVTTATARHWTKSVMGRTLQRMKVTGVFRDVSLHNGLYTNSVVHGESSVESDCTGLRLWSLYTTLFSMLMSTNTKSCSKNPSAASCPGCLCPNDCERCKLSCKCVDRQKYSPVSHGSGYRRRVSGSQRVPGVSGSGNMSHMTGSSLFWTMRWHTVLNLRVVRWRAEFNLHRSRPCQDRIFLGIIFALLHA